MEIYRFPQPPSNNNNNKNKLQALQEVVVAFAPNQISYIWMRGTHALLPNMLKKKIVVGI